MDISNLAKSLAMKSTIRKPYKVMAMAKDGYMTTGRPARRIRKDFQTMEEAILFFDRICRHRPESASQYKYSPWYCCSLWYNAEKKLFIFNK